jgi:hypothetical protein
MAREWGRSTREFGMHTWQIESASLSGLTCREYVPVRASVLVASVEEA